MKVAVVIPEIGKLQKRFHMSPDIVEKEMGKAIKRGLTIIQRRAIEEAPVFQGRLRASMRIDTTDPMRGILSPTAKYAEVVHQGRKPGSPVPMKPIKKWAEKKGLNPYAVAKSIEKKGTKANPFMRRAAEGTQSDVRDEFRDALKRVNQQLLKF